MMKTLLSLIFVAAAWPALAATPYGAGFAGGNPHDYIEGQFQPGQIRIAQLDGVQTLLISAPAGSVRLKPVSVTPATKYTLSFEGSFAGDIEALEENPRFAIFTQPGRKSLVLPSREIQFLDAAGKTMGERLTFSMPFREKHSYTDVFHTPPGAATLRLVITSGNGVTFALRNLKLEQTADEGALNVNPTFAHGPHNYSGWRSISAGGKIITLGGQTVFDSKYGSCGASFPLREPGTYALSAKATGNGYNSVVIVDVFDKDGKKLMSSRVRQFGRTSYFVPPKEAVSASFLVYSCLLEEVRLIRVGDEKAI